MQADEGNDWSSSSGAEDGGATNATTPPSRDMGSMGRGISGHSPTVSSSTGMGLGSGMSFGPGMGLGTGNMGMGAAGMGMGPAHRLSSAYVLQQPYATLMHHVPC